MSRSIYIKEITYKIPKHRGLRKAGGVLYTVFAGLLFGLGIFLALGIKWVLKTWSNLSMEQLLYQLSAETAGVDQELVMDGVASVGTYTVLGLLLFVLLAVALTKRQPKARLIFNTLALAFGLILAVMAFKEAWEKLQVEAYLDNRNEDSAFVDVNYVDSASVAVSAPENKRNLLFIFMESLEVTYADTASGGAYEENYIPELTALAKEGESFAAENSETLNGAYVLPYSSWTVAGLYTQNTALPLKTTNSNNEMETQESFLPQVTALGDILQKDGYRQIFQCGSDATFAGRRLFFETHGDYEIKDLLYARETGQLPPDYAVFWGYEDAKLYEFAQTYLTEAAAGEEPFNYTMLTVDTHFEDGYICEDCESLYPDNQYANVIRCSSKKMDAFIAWVQAQSWYENTTVVIVGDHLTMDSDFCAQIEADYERKVYVNILNAAVTREDPAQERIYCEEDIMPTVLAALGYTIPGDRLGLGVNLYSSVPTLAETYGISYISAELQKNSEVLDNIAASIDKAAVLAEDVAQEDPYVDITFVSRDEAAGILTWHVGEIISSADVIGVKVRVWTAADQSDAIEVNGVRNEDDTFSIVYGEPPLAAPENTYTMQVSVICGDGSTRDGKCLYYTASGAQINLIQD